MLALLINPDLQDISYVKYNPEDFDSHTSFLQHLIGENFQFEYAFRNGDYLYTAEQSESDQYAIGFELDGVSDILFGRAIIVSFEASTAQLKTPLITMHELREKIYFYSLEETLYFRDGMLFKELGC